MAIIIFWTSFSLLCHAFIGYPLLLRGGAFFLSRRPATDEQLSPMVSLILSVHNEEAVMGEKIRNFHALGYPADKLEFVIVSDGCSDGTEAIVRSHADADPRIRLLVQGERGGKTLALNRGVTSSRGSLLIFTDANSLFAEDAVAKLVRHFADPEIGLVSGRSVYLDPEGEGERSGGAYRAYEEMVKGAESAVGSIIGADGAIYALRRELYEPLEPRFINDFLHTVQVVLKGYRAVSDPEAVCREVVDETYEGEFRRQTRIMAQSWLIFLTQIGRLVARGRFLYAVFFISHKFLRWLTLPFLLALVTSALFLLRESVFYGIVCAGVSVGALLALTGARGRGGGLGQAAYLFFLLHAAALYGLFRLISGNQYTTWNPRAN